MEILWGILLAVFCLVCLLIVAIVLLQPHQGEGIAGVFGGGGGEQFLGAKSISTAVWVTSTLAGVYLILALTINKIAPSISTDSSVMAGESTPPPPAVPPGETPPTPPQKQAPPPPGQVPPKQTPPTPPPKQTPPPSESPKETPPPSEAPKETTPPAPPAPK